MLVVGVTNKLYIYTLGPWPNERINKRVGDRTGMSSAYQPIEPRDCIHDRLVNANENG